VPVVNPVIVPPKENVEVVVPVSVPVVVAVFAVWLPKLAANPKINPVVGVEISNGDFFAFKQAVKIKMVSKTIQIFFIRVFPILCNKQAY
jgi:hypothetical protein